MSIGTSQLLESLKWRYATKKFDPNQVIPESKWEALSESLLLTPSSYGLQPWKFLVITNPEIKAQLKPVSWNQSQVTDCSHFVVFTIKKNLTTDHVDSFIKRTAEVRGVAPESLSGYRNIIVSDVVNGPRSLTVNEWATRQVYIALGNFMTAAALVGVDTCPMEGIEPANYDKVLELPTKGYATVVACAAGYRASDDKYAELAKVRFPISDVIETLA
ncbi:nitroreductase [Synechococcus sp. PCC 7502]|uniref:NAD(P)H-dependent oxidoreductase n=1 Tax=Synechococcus sp. PCC 7502 TaxID=1173263 RepID=UPI00029FE2FD|nr:NAD(P)H-dependent oxidoreductase [Synechococcus sp. PCC 7502]AFY72885.1 nitroreductase [Synechococcus sp. PCC 7502]